MTHSSTTPPFRSGLFKLALLVGLAGVHGVSACLISPTEEGESGTRYALADTATEVRRGVELIAWYDSSRNMFTGTVTNTTTEAARQIRVEIHLSNGVEVGPTPRVDLAPGESEAFELDADGYNFDWWTVHVEIGSDSG